LIAEFLEQAVVKLFCIIHCDFSWHSELANDV
jgi:hypothetical protein